MTSQPTENVPASVTVGVVVGILGLLAAFSFPTLAVLLGVIAIALGSFRTRSPSGGCIPPARAAVVLGTAATVLAVVIVLLTTDFGQS